MFYVVVATNGAKMKSLICVIAALMLIGCVPEQIKQQQVVPNKSDVPRAQASTETKPKEDPRIAYLKDQAILMGRKLDKFYEVDSVFAVMEALQDGILTTDDLAEAMFYFKDTDGNDTGYLYNSTYFTCVQVIEIGELENSNKKKVTVYQALYSNSQIDMTVSVYWVDTRPLQGQKLNLDFLVYDKTDTYKNKKDQDRTEVVFWRPKWAGRNGYTYY